MALKGGQKGQIQGQKRNRKVVEMAERGFKILRLAADFVIHLAIFDLLFGHCTHF